MTRLEGVPSGQSGEWSIERHVVEQREAQFYQLRAAINGHSRYSPAGRYVGLRRGKTLVMSNTPDELRDLLPIRRMATGHVLIAGLGLGCAVDVVLEKPTVTKVTVVERSPDVIALVGGSFTDPRVEILHADIWAFRPVGGVHFGAVWFDIWDSISLDNLPEMARLHRRFRRHADWVGSWCQRECRRQQR